MRTWVAVTCACSSPVFSFFSHTATCCPFLKASNDFLLSCSIILVFAVMVMFMLPSNLFALSLTSITPSFSIPNVECWYTSVMVPEKVGAVSGVSVLLQLVMQNSSTSRNNQFRTGREVALKVLYIHPETKKALPG